MYHVQSHNIYIQENTCLPALQSKSQLLGLREGKGQSHDFHHSQPPQAPIRRKYLSMNV